MRRIHSLRFVTESEQTLTSRVDLSLRKRLFLIAIYLLFITGLCWLGMKVFWKFRYSVPLTKTTQQMDLYEFHYPELWSTGAADAEVAPDDNIFDVLLLGGSVLEQVSEEFEQQLHNCFEDEFGLQVRVFTLSKSAHTSRDSFLKYIKLSDKQFDLVVVYHGINDVRMNCCPESVFKDDYTHCAWYRSLQRRLAAGKLTIPGLIREQTANVFALGEPEDKFLEFGGTIKTARPFRHNLEKIVWSAHVKDQIVLLMTFAFFVPTDYSQEKFKRGELDYRPGRYHFPLETWGKPCHVVATIKAHNAQIRDLVKQYDTLIFVDQHRQLQLDGRHFSDPCHLTDVGCRAFVANMLPPILKRISAHDERTSVSHQYRTD